MLQTSELTVGQLAKRSGLTVSALHFYERKGLISSERTAGNQRRYPRTMLRRLAIIKAAQKLGIGLAEISRVFETVPVGKVPTNVQWARFTAQWRDMLNQRITSMTLLRDQWEKCIGCGCLSLSQCPMQNPDDILGKFGPGARLLNAML